MIHYASDLHIDFYLTKTDRTKCRKIADKIAGDGRILLIAGDIGHYNDQNLLFIEVLKERYDFVVATAGNHDLYVPPQSNQNSLERLKELSEMANRIDGVHFFDGLSPKKPIEIDGIRIYANPSWYDLKKCEDDGYTEEMCVWKWKEIMGDASYIKIDNRPLEDPRILADLFITNMRKSLANEKVDIIMTHVPPLWLHSRYPSIGDHFFHFNGTEFFDKTKIFIFGHTHREVQIEGKDINLLANPYGYPGERTDYKICTLSIGKRM